MDERGDVLVTAVVVNWGSAGQTIRLVESLAGSLAGRLRFVVVENGSGDDSARELQKFIELSPSGAAVAPVVSRENTGFTGGVNLGVGAALKADPKPGYIWLLNPDTKATPATLEELVRVSRASGAPIVSASGATAAAGLHGDSGWPRQFFARPKDYQIRRDDLEWWPVDRYNGSCALFRADLIETLIAETGHFQDETLFMDWDELECSLRARRFGGHAVMARDARMEHGGPRTIGRTSIAAARQYYISRNGIAVSRRHMPGWQFWPALPVHFVRDLAWFARLRLRGMYPNEPAYIAGAFDGLRGRSGRWSKHPRPTPASRWTSSNAPGDQLRVTAVVLTWNTADLAIQTIRSLEGAFSEGLRIVLVDNGSIDDSVGRIRAYLEETGYGDAVTLVASETNLGFPGGVNLGTEHALRTKPPPDYIWTLNPDAVVEPETMRELVAVAQESGAGIVGVGGGGGLYSTPNAWPLAFFTTPPFRMKEPPLELRWWPAGRYGGSCALFDAGLVRELIAHDGSFLDASLFLDWDEWDCTRRAARLGASVVLSRDAHEMHDAFGRTFGPSPMAAARQYYQSRNAIAVSRRFMPRWMFWPTLPLHLLRDLSWFLRLRLRGTQPNEKAYLAGAVDGLRGRMGRWKHHPETPAATR